MVFFKKYRLTYLICAVVVMLVGSIMWFYDFATEKDGMKLIGGIVWAVMALFYIEDLYLFYKKRKSEQVKIEQ